MDNGRKEPSKRKKRIEAFILIVKIATGFFSTTIFYYIIAREAMIGAIIFIIILLSLFAFSVIYEEVKRKHRIGKTIVLLSIGSALSLLVPMGTLGQVILTLTILIFLYIVFFLILSIFSKKKIEKNNIIPYTNIKRGMHRGG